MKGLITLVCGALLATAGPALAQPPSDPALLVPQQAPLLDYVPVAEPVTLPPGLTMGPSAAVAFDARGHLFVLTRGNPALWEFDPDGQLVRSFGADLFTRSHGLHIDHEGNLWVTDVGSHIVVKLDASGQVLMTIGVKGEAGEWNEATGSHRLNQPNEVAVADNGDVFIAQGHTPGTRGDPRVLKFDRTGRFLATWGGKGTGPGQFDVAHGISIDAKGLLWVADRENQRIQIFDQEGTFVRQVTYAGLPCGVDIGADAIYMVNGFTGQILKLDLDGAVLAAVGHPGKGLGEFGEAHYIAASPRGELYVADTVNRVLHKFVKDTTAGRP
jgi:sugar lactone lactonase YvrE